MRQILASAPETQPKGRVGWIHRKSLMAAGLHFISGMVWSLRKILFFSAGRHQEKDAGAGRGNRMR